MYQGGCINTWQHSEPRLKLKYREIPVIQNISFSRLLNRVETLHGARQYRNIRTMWTLRNTIWTNYFTIFEFDSFQNDVLYGKQQPPVFFLIPVCQFSSCPELLACAVMTLRVSEQMDTSQDKWIFVCTIKQRSPRYMQNKARIMNSHVTPLCF